MDIKMELGKKRLTPIEKRVKELEGVLNTLVYCNDNDIEIDWQEVKEILKRW